MSASSLINNNLEVNDTIPVLILVNPPRNAALLKIGRYASPFIVAALLLIMIAALIRKRNKKHQTK